MYWPGRRGSTVLSFRSVVPERIFRRGTAAHNVSAGGARDSQRELMPLNRCLNDPLYVNIHKDRIDWNVAVALMCEYCLKTVRIVSQITPAAHYLFIGTHNRTRLQIQKNFRTFENFREGVSNNTVFLNMWTQHA